LKPTFKLTISGDNRFLLGSKNVGKTKPANIRITELIKQGYCPGHLNHVKQGVWEVESRHHSVVDIEDMIFVVSEDNSHLSTYIPSLPLGMYFSIGNPHIELINDDWIQERLVCDGN